MRNDQRLVAALLELSDVHKGDFDEASYAHSLARWLVQLLDVDAAGLLLAGDNGQLEAVGATTDTVRLLQLIQLHLDDGPGLDGLRTRKPVTVPDLRSELRWGTFRTDMLNAGFSAVHAVPLQLRGDTVGSICLYRRRAGELSGDDLSLGDALMQVATACLLLRRGLGKADKLTSQLQTALNTRVAIEQAKGILAGRRGGSLDSAFELMRSFARHERSGLNDVAQAVIEGSPSVASLTSSRVTEPRRAG
jgi:GAF domain-containing protein